MNSYFLFNSGQRDVSDAKTENVQGKAVEVATRSSSGDDGRARAGAASVRRDGCRQAGVPACADGESKIGLAGTSRGANYHGKAKSAASLDGSAKESEESHCG